MSDKRLTTATIDGISYKLGEELNVNLANTDAAGIIKVGTKTNNWRDDTNNYQLGIDNTGIGYVNIPAINSSNDIGIASSTKPGLVLIPSNSGLKLNPDNGGLVINLQAGYGIGTSQPDSNNPSYLKLETATDNTLGGIKTGYTNSSSSNNYGVKLDNNGKAYVEVPIQSITNDIDNLTPNIIKIYSVGSDIAVENDIKNVSPVSIFKNENTEEITNINLNINSNNCIYYICDNTRFSENKNNIYLDIKDHYLNRAAYEPWQCSLIYENKNIRIKDINFLFMGTQSKYVSIEDYFSVYYSNGKTQFLKDFESDVNNTVPNLEEPNSTTITTYKIDIKAYGDPMIRYFSEKDPDEFQGKFFISLTKYSK